MSAGQKSSLDIEVPQRVDIGELVGYMEEKLKRYRHKITVSTTNSNGTLSSIDINVKIER